MIQRIQTLFLLIVSFLLSLTFYFPLATFESETYYAELISGGILKSGSEEFIVWPMMVMVIVMVALPIVTIGFYKKRMLQIRLTVFSAVLEILSLAMVWYQVRGLAATMYASEYTYNFYLLPVIVAALIFNILAIKRIGNDEMLVRSLNSNRIR